MRYYRKANIFTHNFFYCFKVAVTDTIKHDGVEHAGYISFLGILSIFPFLVLFVSLAGLFGETQLGERFVDIFLSNIPLEVSQGLEPRINEIMSGPPQSLLTIAILGAIWTASSSVEGLRTIFNRAYRVSTPPSYLFRRLLSIGQFLVITFLLLSSMFIIVTTPLFFDKILALLNMEYLHDYGSVFVKMRFIVTSIIIFCAVSSIYYVIPNLRQKWMNVCPGALMVLCLWSISGSLFSLYLRNFDQVNLIYGSLASFIIALLFFYIMAMILIFGAEFNYAIEKITGFNFIEKKHSLKTKELTTKIDGLIDGKTPDKSNNASRTYQKRK